MRIYTQDLGPDGTGANLKGRLGWLAEYRS
jgi:hypothetical protein